MGTVPGLVTVRNQSSTHFNLKLLTRGIGRLRIRIRAEVRGKKYSDTVEKNLFVKVSTCICTLCTCVIATGYHENIVHIHSIRMYLPICNYLCMYM